ncbi:hypothetical protein AAHB60_16880 [Pseudomonas aeruginosa]
MPANARGRLAGWVSAELCVADDPLFVRKVVARLKAAVDWQRQRAA